MLVVNANDPPVQGLRCRQIEEADIDAVATLLTQGFPLIIGNSGSMRWRS